MSRFHGEQYWSEIQHRAKRAWRELNDEDFDHMEALRRDREVRSRDQRGRARRRRLGEYRESES